jgi:NAD(P)-dependent dehydrogenase (short-subunit alcohol dehydrogenase family)
LRSIWLDHQHRFGRRHHRNPGTAYSSSKFALEGLSRSAAYLFADWDIRCNVLQPGFIATKMTAKMTSNPPWST